MAMVAIGLNTNIVKLLKSGGSALTLRSLLLDCYLRCKPYGTTYDRFMVENIQILYIML